MKNRGELQWYCENPFESLWEASFRKRQIMREIFRGVVSDNDNNETN